MNLLEEYQNQQNWRCWEEYFQFIPMHSEDHIVDLGCSVGNVSHLLSHRVEQVIGIDLNNEFVEHCQSKRKPNEYFLCQDIAKYDYKSLERINGIWASFSLSYLEKPVEFLSNLREVMERDSWIALVDVSCFISGNMSVDSLHYNAVREFELESYKSGKYDFNFGSKMKAYLESAGFIVTYQDNNVTDLELNFDGSANSKVFENWRARLQRLNGMRNRFSNNYLDVCGEILESISSEEHRKRENVKFVVAKKS